MNIIKQLIIAFLLMFSSLVKAQQPQVYSNLTGIVDVTSSINTSGSMYDIVIQNFTDITNRYNVFDIAQDQYLWTLPKIPGNCNRYKVLSIVSGPSPGQVTLTVINPDVSGLAGAPQNGTGYPIFKHTPNRDYPLYVSSQPTLSGFMNPAIQTCVMTHLILALDKDISNIAAGAVDNREQYFNNISSNEVVVSGFVIPVDAKDLIVYVNGLLQHNSAVTGEASGYTIDLINNKIVFPYVLTSDDVYVYKRK